MEQNFDELLERGCLFDSPIRNKNRIRVRRKKSDPDFHLSIVNDVIFQIMMNNRSRFQFPCMLISLIFHIPYENLLKEAEFYKEFIDREKLDSKGFIADSMIIYRDTIFNIEMNGSHTLARNQDYIHKAATIKNRRGKKVFKLMNYCQINLNNFNIVGHDDIIETYKPLNHDGYLYGYQIFVNVFLLNLRDKYYNEGVESLNETEKYIMGLVETSWTRAKELKRGSEILMDYYRELETIEYIDLPDPIDKVAEEIEIEKSIAREDGFLEGLRDGLKKGEKEGRKTGRKAGRKAGRKEGKIAAYQTIAKNLHSSGMTLETIANHLKISIDETEKLLNGVNIFE